MTTDRYAPPTLAPGTLRITPLGGLGEVGRNMTVYEIDGKLHTFAHELDRWTAVEAFADEYQGRPTPAMGR